jgi:hypothetical protein
MIMEYLVVGLLGLVALLLLLPRQRGSFAVGPLVKPAIVGGVLLAGWLAYSALSVAPRPTPDALADSSVPHERRTDQTMDYAAGDEALRALLSQ